MSGTELFSWYGVGFVAVFAVGLVLLLIGLLGLGGDHDADISHDADTSHDQESAAHSALLDFLGIGRCPLSIVLMVMCFLFALVGIVVVTILRAFHVPGMIVGAVAYPLAAVLSFALTGAIARLIGRILPTSETYVESESHHIGSVGKAVYAFEDGKGFIQVRDKSGTIHEVSAVSADSELVTAGMSVLVLDYNEGDRTFRVQRAPSEVQS